MILNYPATFASVTTNELVMAGGTSDLRTRQVGTDTIRMFASRSGLAYEQVAEIDGNSGEPRLIHWNPLNLQAYTVAIAAGVLTFATVFSRVEGQGGVADNLDSIAGGAVGDVIMLTPFDAAGAPITVRHAQGGADQIFLSGGANFLMDGAEDFLMLLFDPIKNGWQEVSRSENHV